MASLKDTNILGKLVVTDKIIKSGGTPEDILLANGDTITKSALSGQITNNTTYSFTGGTNCFYVTPSGGSQQTVTVTPSIDLSGYVTLSTLQTISGKKVFSANHGGSSTITSDLDAIKLAAVSRDATKGTYFPGIGWNNLEIWSNNTYIGGAQAWIGTRLVDTSGSERVDLVFATKEDNTSGPIRPIERMCITYQGNVGIGTKEPASLLHVNGKITASSLEVTSILAPTSSGGTTYGVGTSGQVLKSNGTTVYWGADSGGTTFTLPTRLADYSTSGYGDANEATTQGWHYMTTTATNRPPFKQSSNKDYRIMSTAYSASWVQQIATDFRGNDMFLRRRENGTWKPWTPIVRFQDCTTDHKMQTITDNAIPRWDTGGTAMLQNSTATISDNGHLTINTTSDTTMTTPAVNILHTGPNTGSDYADLMVLSGFSQSPYGFRFRTHGSGTAIIQSQRINNNSERFSLSLNPSGGNVGIGTIDPGSKLHVMGTVTCDKITFPQESCPSIYSSPNMMGVYVDYGVETPHVSANTISANTINALVALHTANVYCSDIIQSDSIAADIMSMGGETVATRNWVEEYVRQNVNNNTSPTYNALLISFCKDNLSGGEDGETLGSFSSESSYSTDSLSLRYNYIGLHNIYTIYYLSREGSVAVSCSTADVTNYSNYATIVFDRLSSHTVYISDSGSGYSIALDVTISNINYVD